MKIQGFGSTLREWREEEGMNLTEFAKAVGHDKGLLSKYENDELQMNLDKLDAFAKRLKRDPQQILLRYLRKRYPKFQAHYEEAQQE